MSFPCPVKTTPLKGVTMTSICDGKAMGVAVGGITGRGNTLRLGRRVQWQ